MWGTSEPFLSLKTWMAGGKCKIRTDIEIGHKFRSNAPYATPVSFLVYNKIYLCRTLFPDDLSNKLLACLPQDGTFKKATKMAEEHAQEIEDDRRYYQSIMKCSVYDFAKRFNIQLPP